ncbi:MAG: hypothetical protein V3V75_08010, partial [Thermoguttaceae bacterium]
GIGVTSLPGTVSISHTGLMGGEGASIGTIAPGGPVFRLFPLADATRQSEALHGSSVSGQS